MREFILRAVHAKTSPQFDADDPAKAGRMDIVARCISNALWVSLNVRKDTVFHAVLEGPNLAPKIVTFYGAELKDADYDERSLTLLIQKALKKGIHLSMGEEKEVMSGIKVSKKSFEQLIKEKADDGSNQLIYLHKEGKDIRDFDFKAENNQVFIFGDYSGIPPKAEKLLERYGAERISLGPVMLFAAHCITVAHNEMDRRE